MLYPKNGQEKLSDALFSEPTSEYRGAPFWAWNCALDKEEMTRQIDIMQKMGFGGYHMHVRTGLDTPYLTDEFMQYILHCVKHGKEKEMLSWLYDEDRWPSGAAGGLVTKETRFRARHLLFTPVSYEENAAQLGDGTSSAAAERTQNGTLLACYDVELNEDGSLKNYRVVEKDKPVKGTRWYAYLELATPTGWYNNQTYVNTLDKKAIDRFIEITYGTYGRYLQEDMGKSVPAIFTDEPQFTHKETLLFAKDKEDVFLPWTDDLCQTFASAYGEDLLSNLPQLFWNLPNDQPSVIRYHYHDHVCERFTQAFADNCGAWCRAHNLKLTGHMMEEPTLRSQTAALGEAMRSYRGFDLPGIDMLCARFEFTTAKQTQSAVHQFGYEGMLSELYGVTNWDFDFRGHKLHGDWQAALGVTVRVPHLTWMSMKGEAKRDYPASINYQSPWWKEYSLVEDHFARVNTAMTRGKPLVRVGVIHPVESFWLHWGPEDTSGDAKERLDTLFQNVTNWLLFGLIDFDFISESLLPAQCAQGSAPLKVGQMAYDAIVVPGCETLRTSTLERLEAFQKAGGQLIFIGDAPKWENAKPSERGAKLFTLSQRVAPEKSALLAALEPVRLLDARDEKGKRTNMLLHQLRTDGEGKWLFISHGCEPYNKDVATFHDVRFTLQGHVQIEKYDTQTGKHAYLPARFEGESTCFTERLFDYDSLLLRLTPAKEEGKESTAQEKKWGKPLSVPSLVSFTMDEPNALLLDTAEFALDDEAYRPAMELLRADNECRARLNWPSRKESFAQPWVVPKETIVHQVRLRFTIHCEIRLENAKLAVEDAQDVKITLNGEKVENRVCGWYADRAIGCLSLPALHEGENILEVIVPFGKRTNIEWMYLLGDFSVRVNGAHAAVAAPVRQLGFGSFTTQGLPFYGGNITYQIPFTSTGGRVSLQVPHYRGALTKVCVDGVERGAIIYPPYTLDLGKLPCGAHELSLTLFGNRRNSFGPVHLADLAVTWIGPNAWRSEGDAWSDSYQICSVGVLSEPRLFEE